MESARGSPPQPRIDWPYQAINRSNTCTAPSKMMRGVASMSYHHTQHGILIMALLAAVPAAAAGDGSRNAPARLHAERAVDGL
jgi:hypothetical protein